MSDDAIDMLLHELTYGPAQPETLRRAKKQHAANLAELAGARQFKLEVLSAVQNLKLRDTLL